MLTHRFDDALSLAARLHRDQRRKVSDIPYISHLLAVAALVLEHGGDEDQAIAGLLHDAVEDQGGLDTARLIRERFGPRVEEIVLACSDSDGAEKAPWKERKLAYVASIAEKHPDALLVTTCDKLHNAASILRDFHRVGPAVFNRFTAGMDGTLWYYRSLAERIAAALPGTLSAKLMDVVERLEDLTRSAGDTP
jgi:(p)ppGpp synthase/HD superfamily hydrolase